MLKKHQCIPFLDANKGVGNYSFKRIDKSTVFSLNPNPQTETYDFICDEIPQEIVDHYAPELPQEIFMEETNPMYQMIFEMFYGLPVGSECIIPALICFPPYVLNGTTYQKAWLIDETTIVLGEMNTVDKKISFTLKFGANITRGTYTISGGVPTFTPTSGTAAQLTALTIGSETLSPTFAATTYAYTVTASSATDAITATAASGSKVVILKDGVSITNGDEVTWSTGTNTVEISVRTGGAVSTYTVVVTKA